ncbi:MAG: MTH1187 family thiamine-binding protein [Thermoproteota archaeon]
MTIVVEFALLPLGEGISVSEFLAEGLRELDKRGIEYIITPMGTIFEAEDMGSALELIGEAHEAVFQTGVKRVVTSITIDDRRDVDREMEEKVKSLKKSLGEK